MMKFDWLFSGWDGKTEENDHSAPVLRLTKQPDNAFVQERRYVAWVSPESGTVRTPQPQKISYPHPGGFRIAGKGYRGVEKLRSRVLDPERRLYLDVQGRVVGEIRELFPCFDSYDYAHEDRFEHRLYLTERGRLYMVEYKDEGDTLTVTEDAGEIASADWREMVRLGWVEDVETQTFSSFPEASGKERQRRR